MQIVTNDLEAASAMHADRRSRVPEQGFTLLEVLVAFVIAGLALAVLTRAGLDGLRGATLAARYQEATIRAQSHLAALGDAPPPGDRQGDDGGGFRWHVRVVPLASGSAANSGGSTLGLGADVARVSLMAVSVAISWGEDQPRTVQLDSERVGAVRAAAP